MSSSGTVARMMQMMFFQTFSSEATRCPEHSQRKEWRAIAALASTKHVQAQGVELYTSRGENGNLHHRSEERGSTVEREEWRPSHRQREQLNQPLWKATEAWRVGDFQQK